MSARRRPGAPPRPLFGDEPEPAPEPGPPLAVLAADEALEPFDARRLARSLARDGTLAGAVADEVARAVHRQLEAAGIRVATSALVGELASAELRARGIDVRPRRAGIELALAGVGRLLRSASDPAASGRLLAGQVRREYALAAVWSAPVADAHRRGRIHLGAAEAVDLPEAASVRLGALAGGASRGGRKGAGLEEALEAACALAGYFSGELEIEDLPDLLAAEPGPGRTRSGPGRAARALAALASETPGSAPLSLRVALDPGPAAAAARDLLAAAAVGPDGRRLAIEVGPAFFRAPGHLDALEQVGRVALAGRPLRLRLRRPGSPGDGNAAAARRASSSPLRLRLQTVAVNLPRLGLEAGRDADRLGARLAAALDLAVRAHIEKRVFLEELLARGGEGPLRGLRAAAGPLLALERAEHLVVPIGLGELAGLAAGDASSETGRRTWAGRFLSRLVREVRTLGRRRKLGLVVGGDPDPAVARRLARLDLRDHPGGAGPLERRRRGVPGYAPGPGDPAGEGRLSPLAHLALAGERQARLSAAAAAFLPARALGGNAREAALFLMRAWLETDVLEIVFRDEIRTEKGSPDGLYEGQDRDRLSGS